MNGNNGENPFRLSNRKLVQLMLALTILAWATTTLLRQWGFGQEVGAGQETSSSGAANTGATLAGADASANASAVNAGPTNVSTGGANSGDANATASTGAMAGGIQAGDSTGGTIGGDANAALATVNRDATYPYAITQQSNEQTAQTASASAPPSAFAGNGEAGGVATEDGAGAAAGTGTTGATAEPSTASPQTADATAASQSVSPAGNATANVADAAVTGDSGDAAMTNLPPAPVAPLSVPEPIAAEKYVPGFAGPAPLMGTLELRGEATVYGENVKLKQLCRWSDADATAFAPIADLTLFHLSSSSPYKAIRVEEIRQTLHDAGINVATIDFSGATSCTVSRSDVRVDEREALQDWIDAKNSERRGSASTAGSDASSGTDVASGPDAASGAAAASGPNAAQSQSDSSPQNGSSEDSSSQVPSTRESPAGGAQSSDVQPDGSTNNAPASGPAAGGAGSFDGSASATASTAPDSGALAGSAAVAARDGQACQTLKDLITADACTRLGVSPDDIQMTFNPADEKVLALATPYFRFNLSPVRVFNLGDVSWDVLIVTDGGTQKASIEATARAWQTELVVQRPLAFKQVIQDSDLQVQRVLVDHVSDEHVLTKDQAVGQLAARDLKPGVVMTALLVDPVPLCKPGDLVTVTVQQGGVQIRLVARALEGGAYGQTVRVRNESTQDVLDATLTGPQEARIGPVTALSFAGN